MHKELIILILSTIICLIIIINIFSLNIQKAESVKQSANQSTTLTKKNLLVISFMPTKTAYYTGDIIPIIGLVRNDTSGVANTKVTLEATKDDKPIYRSSVITDSQGKFTDLSLVIPQEGTIKITANLADSDVSTTQAMITILVSKPLWSLYLVILLIAVAFALVIFGSYKEEKYAIVGAIISVAIGYVIISYYPPLDSTGNAALSTMLFAPIATYVVDIIKKRREAASQLESAVSKYREDNLKTEVNNLLSIYDEICQHESVFQAQYDDLSKKLSNAKYVSIATKVGTMSNLPALRIYKYYYYLDTYNQLLDAIINKKGNLSDPDKYKKFDDLFQKLKKAYSSYNEALYVNLIYNIGEIQYKFLSFPTIEFPVRISGPLLHRLRKINALRGNEVWNKDIYSEAIANKLMRELGSDYNSAYEEIEKIIHELLNLK